MAKETLNNGVSFGEQRTKINSNFTELYSILNGLMTGAMNKLPYLNSSGVLVTSDILQFDGTNFSVTGNGNLLVGGSTVPAVVWSSERTFAHVKGSGANKTGEVIVESNNGNQHLSLFASSTTADCGLWTTKPISLLFGNNNVERARISSGGNFLINATTSSGWGDGHRISKNASQGSVICTVDGQQAEASTYFVSVTSGGFSTAPAAQWVGKNSGNNRSINTGGTINASGADYAEYERNNGLKISKGQVVGFKTDGTLTLTFSEAIRFGIKSTDPSYVGGDNWGSEDIVGLRPIVPVRILDETDQRLVSEATSAVLAEGGEILIPAQEAVYETVVIAYGDTDAEWEAKESAYQAEFAEWSARLEAERQKVDRVAYSGKVPVNVQGATPGGYIIAAEDSEGKIIGEFVPDPDFAQYKKAVGRVNRILEDGRCEVAVIIH